jgi:hypothetical protein
MNILKDRIAYLKDNPHGYWFKRKLYGWGWVPVKWQGWAVVVAFIVLLIANAHRLNPEMAQDGEVKEFLVETALLVLLLLAICYRTGEAPKWMWGLPRDEEA